MSAGIRLKTSGTQNYKAQLANAYNELGKELASSKIKVIGNYTLGKVIGEGAYGKVRMGTHRLTSTRVAMKQIPKAMSASLTREIHHHRQLHHPNVTQMYEVIATESSIWIVTELCSGGELFDYLVEKGRLEENEARTIFGQLCLAVAYLHERNIVHRDLKLENVLLDERCRVKLGDFGFTREFDRHSLMETFCGTTGYASPEMLQGEKYVGPEVDIWSLGIILYTLLTGTLPFDDDDEIVMRDKIIREDFEDPAWLSSESRDLIKNILQKDPAKRLSIPQILSHSWFTNTQRPGPSVSLTAAHQESAPPPPSFQMSLTTASQGLRPLSAVSNISDSSFQSATSNWFGLTPDNTPNGDGILSPHDALHNPSQTTLKPALTELLGNNNGYHSDTVPDTKEEFPLTEQPSADPKAPPSLYPTRTPVRTKRRSMSSVLSDNEPGSPTMEAPSNRSHPQDFSSLLNTPAPIIFTTPLERGLLNSLSMLGFDTAQIVHSVLSDACDAAGAVWWMLCRKAEKPTAEEEVSSKLSEDVNKDVEADSARHRNDRVNASVQTVDTREHRHFINLVQSAPELAFIPPTPTVPVQPSTPPHSRSRSSPLLSPSTSAESGTRSQPTTPSSQTSKNRKPRSGSVSIMQRATTALEAAGLVRKKSVEAVKDDREQDRDRSREMDRKNASVEEPPRSSHGSTSSKLTKSPPTKSHKDHGSPSTSEHGTELHHPQPIVGSPWILTGRGNSPPPAHSSPPPRSIPSPGDTVSALPTFHDVGGKSSNRNRAGLLTAFRLWFVDDRKGKRKDPAAPMPRGQATPAGSSSGTKRRASGSGTNHLSSSRKKNHKRPQGPSISSRRSSSVNSRRSSATSGQLLVLDSPLSIHDPGQNHRSMGTHTPISDHPSRPSSIRSFSTQQRHRKSPSVSSVNSTHLANTSSTHKYHRRAGSTNSTRVTRQSGPTRHMRSNSAASSIHSLPSSRPTSFYGESSDPEGPRNSSPFRRPSSRRSTDDTPRRSSHGGNSQFVAQKRQTPFLSPSGYSYSGSIGRSSWKKSWGLEPPGWQSRTTHLPIEVLAISPPDGPTGIRDVFSGRTSLSMGDESDWVDEDDDLPAFAGGLGQTPAPVSTRLPLSGNGVSRAIDSPTPLSTSAKGLYVGRKGKRTGGRTTAGSSGSDSGSGGATPASPHRSKTAGHSPAGRRSPIPGDSKQDTMGDRPGGRRQLPTGRTGPAFRGNAIQEEDEEEE